MIDWDVTCKAAIGVRVTLIIDEPALIMIIHQSSRRNSLSEDNFLTLQRDHSVVMYKNA